uniref:Ovule protein n=1 Tax=Syphacia muris TaxID=451379 RepID=A0A0N5ABC9_9BILA
MLQNVTTQQLTRAKCSSSSSQNRPQMTDMAKAYASNIPYKPLATTWCTYMPEIGQQKIPLIDVQRRVKNMKHIEKLT